MITHSSRRVAGWCDWYRTLHPAENPPRRYRTVKAEVIPLVMEGGVRSLVTFKHCRRQAFSLAELSMVIAIIGVLAAVAVPRFAGAIARQRGEQASRRIALDLAYARQRAIQTSVPQSVVFDVATDSYTLPGVPHLDDSTKDYKVVLSDEPYSVHLVKVDFGGTATVTFDIHGTADSTGTVAVEVGSGTNEYKKIVVDPAQADVTRLDASAL